jgi:hypothetical protein
MFSIDHPTINEGMVRRKVCFSYLSNCCQWSTFIRVKNCSGFYVYEFLKPPSCNLRYCGNGPGILSTQRLYYFSLSTLNSKKETMLVYESKIIVNGEWWWNYYRCYRYKNAFYFFSIFIMLIVAYVGDTLGDYRDYRDGDDDDNWGIKAVMRLQPMPRIMMMIPGWWRCNVCIFIIQFMKISVMSRLSVIPRYWWWQSMVMMVNVLCVRFIKVTIS